MALITLSRMHLLASLVICTFSLAAMPAPIDEGQSSPPPEPLTAQSDEWSISLESQTACCPSSLVLELRQGGLRYPLTIESRIQKVHQLEIVSGHDRLLVIGSLPTGGETILVVDLSKRIHEETIWTFGSSLSPTKRFLAYQTHYPEGAVPVSSRRSIVLLYDLARSAEANRAGPRSDWPAPNAGQPIFPSENAETGSWDVMASPEEYSVGSPFLWTDDEHRIVFLAASDLVNPKGATCYIVRVDLNEAWEPRSIVPEELTPENVDLSGHTVPLEYILDRPLCIPTQKLTWTHEGRYDEVTADADPARQLGPKVRIRVP